MKQSIILGIISLMLLASISSFASSDCGQHCPKQNFSSSQLTPIDLDKYRLVTSTKGEFYFWGPGEVGSRPALDFISEGILTRSTEGLMYDFGDLAIAGEKKEYTCLISEGFPKVVFFIFIQGKNMVEIYDPNGRMVSESPSYGFKTYHFTYMSGLVVEKPIQGNWTIKINGKGKYLVSVRSTL